MSLWTKLAAVFSILASVVTIYNFGFKPKDSPSLWAMVTGQSGASDPQSCGIVKRSGLPTDQPGLLRSGPGADHPQVANLPLASKVIVLQKVDNWMLVRLDEGLSSSVQGWITAPSIDGAPCRGPATEAKATSAPPKAPTPAATTPPAPPKK